MGDGDRKQDEERRIEDRGEAEPFSRSGQKDVFKDPAEIDGKGEGNRKEELEKDIGLHLLFNLLNRFTDEERTNGLQDQPVGQDDAEGEFVPQKRDEEFP